MSKPTSLVMKLFAEVFQTERSAIKHPAVEAERLGACLPGDAMRAISAHASRIEPSLNALAHQRGAHASTLGTQVGDLFSIVRDKLADYATTSEQSYRGTLLGIRHGVDVIALFGLAARAEDDLELAEWCDRWLEERRPLVEGVAHGLTWFAHNPERALQNAKG